MQLKRLNELPSERAVIELKRCCGSHRWVEAMLQRRPFANTEQLFAAAAEIWWQLGEQDWREAFSHHPKIGDVKKLRERFGTTAAWSQSEQSGVDSAGEEVLRALADGNVAYEKKFGYIFIVCATGKTAEQMLNLLQARLPNESGDEIRIAAEEQAKITRIRLEKVCLEAQSQPTC